MQTNNNIQKIGDILKIKKTAKIKKPPAYEWQDLALKIIKELNIPKFKRSSIFQICKKKSKYASLIDNLPEEVSRPHERSTTRTTKIIRVFDILIYIYADLTWINLSCVGHIPITSYLYLRST